MKLKKVENRARRHHEWHIEEMELWRIVRYVSNFNALSYVCPVVRLRLKWLYARMKWSVRRKEDPDHVT